MKFLFVSEDGDGLGIGERFVREGHDVRFWIRNPALRRAGVGLVNRVPSYRPHLDWADVVVADMVGFGHLEKLVDRRAKAHIGFNQLTDLIELDRAKQSELFKKVGIRTPESFHFESPSAAEDILEIWQEPGYAVKPSGNQDTRKTFVVRDKETFKWALGQLSGSDPLVVQRIVEGVEISTEGWFDGSDWIPRLWNHTFEEKKFLDGGLGPNVGSMGSVVWGISNPGTDALALEVQKLAPFLRKADYKGPIDLNAIVAEGESFALEITARFGYDAVEALMTLVTSQGFANALWELANGLLVAARIPPGQFATAVRVSVPPYPFGEPEKADAGLPVNIPSDALENSYLTDCMAIDNMLQWAAGDGVVCKITGVGNNPAKATKNAYANVAKVEIQDMMYRSDIGARAEGDIKQLRKWGVI